jgi:hypothetical protein
MSVIENLEQKAVPIGKIFTDRKIWLGSMLGGPLIAGYIIYKNYQTFNELDKARKVVIVTLLITVIIFSVIFMIPDEIKIPNQLIPFLYTFIAWGFLKKYQGGKIEEHISSGGEVMGWGNTVLISILGLIITFVPVFIIIIILS